MKKGVFTVAKYFAPKRGWLSMALLCHADKKTGVSSLLFGLSGTGKTTLSADPNVISLATTKRLEVRASFNIERRLLAKAINLTP